MNLFEYTYDLVRQIPPGRVSSYGAVANALGDKVASRAVGRMMNQNPDADSMPCFKIVHSDGSLGGFGLGINDKIRRLRNDGIQVKDGRIVDFEQVFFVDFKTEYPLRKLRQEQITLGKKIQLDDCFSDITTVAGVDVAYPESEFDETCGACVVLDFSTKQVVEETTVFMKTEFPFISTYFAYREFPIVQQLIKKLRTPPSLVMLDGNGILHPYRCGFASYAGLMFNLPTVGVAKTLLYGRVTGSLVSIDNEQRGYAFSVSGKKPVYVSPGHRVSLATSLKIVKHLSRTKHPEPLRLAHGLTKNQLHKQR